MRFLSRLLSRGRGTSADLPASIRPVAPNELFSLFGPRPTESDPTRDQIASDVWAQPYRSPLDIDRYGNETPEIRRGYQRQYREVPVIRAAVRGKADDIACLEVTVLPADKDDQLSCLAAEFVEWSVGNTPMGWHGLLDAVYTPASVDGFSAGEKRLDLKRWKGRTVWGLAHVRNLDTSHIRLKLDEFRNVLAIVNTIRGLQYHDPDDVILHAHNPMYSNPFGQSDLRATTRAANILEDVYKVWFVALKVYGLPYMHGKAKSPQNVKAMATALESIRAGGYAVTGPEDEIAVLDLAGAAAAAGFRDMVQTQREDVFYAIRGAALPFLEGDGGASAHGDTQVEQGTSDAGEKMAALRLASTLNWQLIPWLVRPNFGDIPMPTIRLGGTNYKQTKDLLDIIKTAQDVGIKPSSEWAHKVTNIPPERDDQDKLVTAQEQQQAAQQQPPPGAAPAPAVEPAPATFSAAHAPPTPALDLAQVARCVTALLAEMGVSA